MSTQGRPPEDDQGGGDPWAAFGYLVAGVGFYGLAGWALGWWLHLDYLAPLGIVIGAVFGLYLVFTRFGGVPQAGVTHDSKGNDSSIESDNTPRPIDDDRGEIA